MSQDILDSIAEAGQQSKEEEFQELTPEQKVDELLKMVDEISLTYVGAIEQLRTLTHQNFLLNTKVKWLEDHMFFLLAKDEDYMKEAEAVAEQMEKEKQNEQESVLSSLPT